MAQKFGFFEFAIYRYKTWSSRLLIESVTMFMSNHYLLFDVTMLISVAIFFYCFNGIFLKEEKYRKLQFVSPVIFLLSFPSLFFTSAGLIATVTNYLFPMISLLCVVLYDSGETLVYNIIFAVSCVCLYARTIYGLCIHSIYFCSY